RGGDAFSLLPLSCFEEVGAIQDHHLASHVGQQGVLLGKMAQELLTEFLHGSGLTVNRSGFQTLHCFVERYRYRLSRRHRYLPGALVGGRSPGGGTTVTPGFCDCTCCGSGRLLCADCAPPRFGVLAPPIT